MRIPRPLLSGALLAACVAAFLGGCQVRHAAVGPRPPPPADLPPYDYWEAGGEIPEPESIELEVETDHYDVRKILLPPRVPPELADYGNAHDPIEIVHFRPRPRGGTPRPLVLVSPILGNDMTLMPEFATGITGIGYHAAVVVRKHYAFDVDTVLEDAEKEFRLLVMRNRQALDWLAARKDVDARRMGTLGVSAGAIISASLAGADPRLRAHVLVFAGGPLADVLADTTEKQFRKYGDRLREEKGLTKDEVRAAFRRGILTDPVRLAPRVRRDDVLLFVATKDRSVPTHTGLRLWRALGCPELRLVPCGHYVAFSLQPWISSEANRFLRSRLGPP